MASQARLDLQVQLQGAEQAAKGLSNIGKESSLLGKAINGLGNLGGGLLSLLTPVGLVTGGIGALGGLLGGAFVGEASEAEQGMAQLNSVLKSTKGAAGLTADQVVKLSQKLSASNGLSKFSGDATLAANNLLLTFTNIGKDVFPLASQAAVDMAQALGGEPVAQATALGKALQNPIEGVTALTRVGVTFSDKQKAVIEQLVKTGDIAGAQKIILGELATEFGGSAAAAAGTFSGKMATLNEKFNDVKETIGNALLPAVSDLATGFIDFGSEALNAITTGDFSKLGQMVGEALSGIVSKVGEFLPQAIAKLGEWGSAFIGWIGPLLPGLLSKAGEFIGGVFGWIGEQLPGLIAKLQEWGLAFINWIGPQLPGWLAAAGDFIGGVLGWIGENIGPIAAKLLEWAGAFIGWVAPLIPELLGRLGSLLIDIGAWIINDALPAIANKLGEWGKAFVDWIGPILPQIPGKLAQIATAIWNWITNDALPVIAQKAGEWGGALFQWAGEIGPKIPGFLWTVITSIGNWVTNDAVPAIGKFFMENAGQIAMGIGAALLASALLLPTLMAELAAAIVRGIADALPGAWTTLTNAFGLGLEGLPDGAAASIQKAAIKTAVAFANELKHALSFIMPAGFLLPDIKIPDEWNQTAQEAGTAVGTNVLEATKKALEAMGDIGRSAVDGLALGISNATGVSMEAARQLATQIIQQAQSTLEAKSPSAVFMRLGQGVSQGLGQGITGAASQATGAMTTLLTSLLGLAQGSLNTGVYTPFGVAAVTGITGGISSTSGQATNAFTTLTTAVRNIATAALNIPQYTPFGIAAVQGVQQGITSTTPTATGATTALTTGIQNVVSGALTIGNYNPFGQNTAKGIAQGVTAATVAATQATSALTAAVRSTADAGLNINTFASYGRRVGDGIAAGIRAATAGAVAAARSLAAQVNAAVAGVLDIHSPSRVMFRLGQMAAKGFELGLADGWKSIGGPPTIGTMPIHAAPIRGGIGGGISFGNITIIAGAGSNGAEIARDFVDELSIRLQGQQRLMANAQVYG